MPKTVPALPGIPPSRYPFSEVVEANGFVFLAGQVGDVPGQPGAVPGGIEAETRQMLDNVGRLLHAAGLDYADVVKCTVYLRDFSEFVAAHEDLADVIADRINKVPGVTGTSTHIAFRTYSRHDLEAAFSLGLDE